MTHTLTQEIAYHTQVPMHVVETMLSSPSMEAIKLLILEGENATFSDVLRERIMGWVNGEPQRVKADLEPQPYRLGVGIQMTLPSELLPRAK